MELLNPTIIITDLKQKYQYNNVTNPNKLKYEYSEHIRVFVSDLKMNKLRRFHLKTNFSTLVPVLYFFLVAGIIFSV